ncbi:MAG: hypothetical protein ACRD3T_09660 [Terriglobia bacterium]
MRNRFERRVLGLFLMLLAICLLPFVVVAGPKILGQIVRSQGTSLGGIPVPNEGSVDAGDTIETTASGSALLRFGSGAEAVLGARTRVTFSGEAGKLTANLAAGGMTIETLGATPFITLTANCRIEPAVQAPVTYVVSFAPGQGTAVQSKNGTVRVTEVQSGRTRLVSSGEQTLIAQNASSPPPAGAQQEPGKASPSLPAGPAQPASVRPQAPVSTSATAPQEGGQPAPSQPAGPSTPAEVRHHGSSGIILLVVGIAGAAGAALAASGGGHGPASPSGP